MKFRWTWCLPLVASMTLAACGTTGGGGASKPGPTGPAGDAASLTAYHWKLQEAFTPAGNEDQSWFLGSSQAPIELDFVDQRVVVKNLCNVISSAYTVEGQRINLQRGMSTLRACNDNQLMMLEQKVARILPTAKQWNVQLGGSTTEQPRLTLQFIDGTRWQLNGKPTAQTQYGSAPERIFLEVGPERKACSAGAGRHQCLQVREIRYGDNGVKTYTGQWENFYSEIEGYKHEAGVSNVLRINRFKRQNVPADASSYVYVLDMVVSSAIADKRK
jgi:heat shock protein HslJ